ncbi:unnamed protein product [Linum tenue]|uniref:LOB domain-containing protein n=1 Tax=Linum tenue TaxID=586396 RepID=A0AAV0P6W8_9ROSI|nr:unnamed protein product [Linum tenue]
MSCNGCRVLRKGCGENCVLRSLVRWIPTPQAHHLAPRFISFFFFRSNCIFQFRSTLGLTILKFAAIFQSLLFEACGRTVNPVNGAVGLLSSGNWRLCQDAVETVLAGGSLQALPGIRQAGADDSSEDRFSAVGSVRRLWPSSGAGSENRRSSGERRVSRLSTGVSFLGEESETTTFESSDGDLKKLEVTVMHLPGVRVSTLVPKASLRR